MTRITRIAIFALVLGVVTLQTGCDQREGITDPDPTVGKVDEGAGLGERLKADRDFKKLSRLLHDADRRARLKYAVGADLKGDEAFARSAARKSQLTKSDRAKLRAIRALSEKDVDQIDKLRAAIVERFPEILELTETQLQDVLASAGAAEEVVLGKTLDQCSACRDRYNNCITSAEFRHALEVMTCALLMTSVYGGTVCYLASMSKYLWSIHSCNTLRSYCLADNGCLGSPKDTL